MAYPHSKRLTEKNLDSPKKITSGDDSEEHF